MKNALLRLREIQGNMSDAETTIAQYISAYPEKVSHMTVRELAEKTYTSPSSVVRMCRSIGFVGYKEFRQQLMLELATLGHEISHEEADITADDSIYDIIEKITDRNVQCLIDSRNLLSEEDVACCVELLRNAHSVLLFGIGSSLCVARDMYLKFLRVNKSCILNDDWHSQLLQARNALPQDVALIFSYSGQTEEMIKCMKALKENGTPCIAVTRFAPSPVAKMADYLLYTSANESLFRIGAISSRLAQLNIVDILYAAFVDAEYDYCLHQFIRTHIDKDNK